MNIEQIKQITSAQSLCGSAEPDDNVSRAFASDLMSDVLTLDTDQLLLITGLCNLQTIRTAEVADVRYILFARGKKATNEMIELARQNSMTLLETNYSVFHVSGLLYAAGIEPVY